MMTVESYGCNYKSELWTIEVRLETGRSDERVKSYMKMLKGVVKQTTQSDARQVSGLGDEAWWGPIRLEKSKALMEKVLGHYKQLRKA